MKNRLLLTLCLTALLSSCTVKFSPGKSDAGSNGGKGTSSVSQSEETDDYSAHSGSGISRTKISTTSKIYLGSLKEYSYLSWSTFSVASDVPYVSLKDYYEGFFNKSLAKIFKVEDDVVTNLNTRSTLRFDVENNSIFSDDFDQFINYTGTKLPVDVFSASEVGGDTLCCLDESASSYTKGSEVTYLLSSYHAELVDYEGGIYVPFSFLDTITTMSVGYRFVWNGSDFYLCDPDYIYNGSSLTSYGSALYSGPINTNSRSQSFADYNYYSFLFEMRNFYGKYYSLGVSSIDSKLEEMGLKSNMTSAVAATADEAIADAINQVFGDGGHTYFNHRGFGVKYSQATDERLSKNILNEDSRYYGTALVYAELKDLRKAAANSSTSSGAALITKTVDGETMVASATSGSTLVIRFDEFSLNSIGKSPSKANVESDKTSTFALIYNSLKAIQGKSIKNVVFDVSMNGGGMATALGQALSFMTDDAISLSVKNPHTGAITKEVIYVDDDFDGDVTDKDSYEGQYNFYILTSPYSFSCANAFPCIAKDNGWAKIIGKKSGGGDCIVASGATPDGTTFRLSGNSSLIHEDGTSFDSGCEVDYALDYSKYYNLSALDSFLSSLS